MLPHDPIGWVVLTILGGCAIGSIELLLIGLVRTWRAGRNGEEALQRVDVLMREGDVPEALAVARRLPGAVSAIIVAGLWAPDEAAADRAMAQAARDERNRLTADVRVLDAIGAGALLLPLAGIGIRAAMRDGPMPIEEWRWSLLMLAVGLGAAMVAVLGRFWLTARVRRLAVDMEKGAALVYNTAR